MLLQSILNRVQKQPGFVYGSVRFVEVRQRPALEIELRPRKNLYGRCSGCRKRAPGYDTLSARHFEFVPLWGLLVFFVYALRRVQCPRCGVRVEVIPWAEGKHQLTTTYAWFLAGWAKRLSWTATAKAFHTSWTHVYRSVAMAVAWGKAHRDLSGIRAIGIDEIQWKVGNYYLTLVYQIDVGRRRLLWIGQKRTKRTLNRFFRWFGPERTAALRFVCSDMWQAYLTVVAKRAGKALHILDRFHVMLNMNKAIDKVRAQEARELLAKGHAPVLTNTRWLLLRRPENLRGSQLPRLAELLRYNLRAVRAWLLREEFQFFWEYRSVFYAERFLDQWCGQAMKSRIKPMQRVAKMLQKHRPLLMNWFRAKGAISNGAVEGLNNLAKMTMRRAFGFRTYRCLEIALFHTLGDLPVPEFTHKFF
jgi:transposase